eukprot:1157550-Pelagomonas_calceolata.AAC.3
MQIAAEGQRVSKPCLVLQCKLPFMQANCLARQNVCSFWVAHVQTPTHPSLYVTDPIHKPWASHLTSSNHRLKSTQLAGKLPSLTQLWLPSLLLLIWTHHAHRPTAGQGAGPAHQFISDWQALCLTCCLTAPHARRPTARQGAAHAHAGRHHAGAGPAAEGPALPHVLCARLQLCDRAGGCTESKVGALGGCPNMDVVVSGCLEWVP